MREGTIGATTPPAGGTAGRNNEHRTITRTARILELVSARPGELRLADLATALAAPKSSVHVLIRGLVSVGYLIDVEGRYLVGYSLGELVRPSETGLTELLTPVLEELRDASGETVTLGLFAGEFVAYLACAQSHSSVRYVPELKTRRPLLPTSIGKLLLATWPEDRLRAHLVTHDPSHVGAAVDLIATVRAEGRAFNRDETLTEVTAVARPYGIRGRMIGGISVGGPSGRVLPRIDELDALLDRALREQVHPLLASGTH